MEYDGCHVDNLGPLEIGFCARLHLGGRSVMSLGTLDRTYLAHGYTFNLLVRGVEPEGRMTPDFKP
jgi:hypothetical protein